VVIATNLQLAPSQQQTRQNQLNNCSPQPSQPTPVQQTHAKPNQPSSSQLLTVQPTNQQLAPKNDRILQENPYQPNQATTRTKLTRPHFGLREIP